VFRLIKNFLGKITGRKRCRWCWRLAETNGIAGNAGLCKKCVHDLLEKAFPLSLYKGSPCKVTFWRATGGK
jgi:hypothetical protein